MHVVVARSTFPSQNVKSTTCSDRFWTFRSFYVAGAGIAHLSKISKTCRFCSSSKSVGKAVGYLKRIWKDALSVASTVQETCSSEMLGGHGRSFPERGCILQHQIFRFGKMILCDRCSISYDLASLFRGRRNALDTWTGKNRKTALVRGRQLTFHY